MSGTGSGSPQGAGPAGDAAVTDPRLLRAHVYALARELGVLVREEPVSVWEARAFPDGRVVVPPIASVLAYFVCLHEVGHLVTWAGRRDELDAEAAATAWALSVALVAPDRVTVRALGEAWVSHGGVRAKAAL